MKSMKNIIYTVLIASCTVSMISSNTILYASDQISKEVANNQHNIINIGSKELFIEESLANFRTKFESLKVDKWIGTTEDFEYEIYEGINLLLDGEILNFVNKPIILNIPEAIVPETESDAGAIIPGNKAIYVPLIETAELLGFQHDGDYYTKDSFTIKYENGSHIIGYSFLPLETVKTVPYYLNSIPSGLRICEINNVVYIPIDYFQQYYLDTAYEVNNYTVNLLSTEKSSFLVKPDGIPVGATTKEMNGYLCGKIDIPQLNISIYLGESKLSIENKIGTAPLINRYDQSGYGDFVVLYRYEELGFNLTYSKSGRLIDVTILSSKVPYMGHRIGEQYKSKEDYQLKEGEDWDDGLRSHWPFITGKIYNETDIPNSIILNYSIECSWDPYYNIINDQRVLTSKPTEIKYIRTSLSAYQQWVSYILDKDENAVEIVIGNNNTYVNNSEEEQEKREQLDSGLLWEDKIEISMADFNRMIQDNKEHIVFLYESGMNDKVVQEAWKSSMKKLAKENVDLEVYALNLKDKYDFVDLAHIFDVNQFKGQVVHGVFIKFSGKQLIDTCPIRTYDDSELRNLIEIFK